MRLDDLNDRKNINEILRIFSKNAALILSFCTVFFFAIKLLFL